MFQKMMNSHADINQGDSSYAIRNSENDPEFHVYT